MINHRLIAEKCKDGWLAEETLVSLLEDFRALRYYLLFKGYNKIERRNNKVYAGKTADENQTTEKHSSER